MKEWPIILLGVVVLAGLAVWQWHEHAPWPGWPWAGPPQGSYMPEPSDPPALVDGINAYDAGDYEKAKTLLLSLAENGDPKAMNMVGLMYDFGKGYVQSSRTACDWYEKSATGGYASGQNNLSICFSAGNGRDKNIARAVEWQTKAATRGHKLAQLHLAIHYRDTDKEKFRHWAVEAMNNGSTWARVALWAQGYKEMDLNVRWTEVGCIVGIGVLGQPPDTCD